MKKTTGDTEEIYDTSRCIGVTETVPARTPTDRPTNGTSVSSVASTEHFNGQWQASSIIAGTSRRLTSVSPPQLLLSVSATAQSSLARSRSIHKYAGDKMFSGHRGLSGCRPLAGYAKIGSERPGHARLCKADKRPAIQQQN